MLSSLAPWNAQAQNSLGDDWLVLVALYDSTHGYQWRNNDNWSNATGTMPDAQTLNSWHGVTVDMQASRVSEIRLEDNWLNGKLPPQIGKLTHLKYLSLRDNYLDGEIPSEIGKLTRLKYLSLWSSNLEGDIPAEIWTLKELKMLNIGDNYELGGIIPPEVGNLTELDTLFVNWGKVSGGLPEEIGNLNNLRLLEIQQNQLIGKLPSSMTNMSQLAHLNFQGQDLCAPREAAFQAWLAGVNEVYGSNCSVDRLPSHLGARIECVNGKAGEFECQNVDLLSHLSKKDMGAEHRILVNDIWGWTDPETHREYALVGKENSVAIVDVTDQMNPVYLGSLPSHDPEAVAIWRDMKVYRNHMFVVADAHGRENGMQVFDLTQLRGVDLASIPATFTETANYREIGNAHNVFVHEETGYAYLAGSGGGRGRCGVGLHIVDVRDPLNPTFAGCHHEPQVGRSFSPGYTHDVQCVIYRGPDATYHGREICVAPSETAINIVDVTDKSNTVSVAVMTYPLVAYSHQGWFTDDHRYFIANDELDEANFRDNFTFRGTRTLFWDLEDLDDPVLLTEYFSPEKTIDHNLYVRENYAYLSNYESGLRILDIEDVSNPVEVAYFDTDPASNRVSFEYGAWSSYPYFKSGIVVVSSMEQGLFVLQPTTLSITGAEQDVRVPEAFSLRGNYPNPFNPSTRITFDLPASAEVTLLVSDMQGRLVMALPGQRFGAGARKSIEFSGEGLASGTYVYRLMAVMEHEAAVRTGVMTLVR
ncbi:MAG: choice-of-anchor B family protein [Bacteroidota bacterium]|nr:choice-of-anchor B family protein [Bacteroidota bacterium]